MTEYLIPLESVRIPLVRLDPETQITEDTATKSADSEPHHKSVAILR